MTLIYRIKAAAAAALCHLFPDAAIQPDAITVSQTKPEFTGDYTIVLFPFVKQFRVKPADLGNQMGEYLAQKTDLISGYEVVSGFLNLSIREACWTDFLLNHFNDRHYGECPQRDHRVMVEYSSPNTNKPLHFGHLRNNFLGFAVSNILYATGSQVVKANLVNDRGIHICKSMVAWQQFGHGATPENTGEKGDHLVGDYYVQFNDELKRETKSQIEALLTNNIKIYDKIFGNVWGDDAAKLIELRDSLQAARDAGHREKEGKAAEEIKDFFQNRSPVMRKAQKMLRDWEAGDPEVRRLWETMNSWVYKGFEATYKKLGIDFDKYYYESETYLLGKKIVEEGLQKGVLFQKEDGSVWIDLTADGLDQKLLLRGDGTSVYMTQDLGTAVLKYKDYKLDKSVYVIADEQNYHMQVLKLILQKLREPCADGIYHLSYGMVELPTGRMKSREGTVVDADDMVDEMIALAQQNTEAAGKTEGFTASELTSLYETIGLGALKFYLLRVEPKKKMIFNPEESIDLHGFTATFVQYAHARICSVLDRAGLPLLPEKAHFQSFRFTAPLLAGEHELARTLEQYPVVLEAAAAEMNPSLLCNYAFTLAQILNRHYDELQIARAESEEKKQLRLMLFAMTGQLFRHSMGLLGIKLPEKM